jgi:two-component system cell cycle response regulator DivK
MSLTLLLADPNPTTQRIVSMVFAKEDIRVVTADDGDQAIKMIESAKPDIVLADVAMKRTGYDVSAFVKQRPELAHIPVLLLAGSLEPVDGARAAAAQCDGVLTKPFDPQKAVARVKELLGGIKGDASQILSGVPRPIERLIEPRQPIAPPAPERKEESPLKLVSKAQTPPKDDTELDWPSMPPPAPPRLAPVVPVAPVASTIPDDDPLAKYFDQLDAAFERLDATPVARGPGSGKDSEKDLPGSDDPTVALDVPTVSALLGEPHEEPRPGRLTHPKPDANEILFGAAPVAPSPAQPPATADSRRGQSTSRSAPWPAPAEQRRSAIADAFEALLAIEEEQRKFAEAAEQAAAQPPAMTDAVLDDIAARVVERLSPEVHNELVTRIVSEVAERLVRQEIERIRQSGQK